MFLCTKFHTVIRHLNEIVDAMLDVCEVLACMEGLNVCRVQILRTNVTCVKCRVIDVDTL